MCVSPFAIVSREKMEIGENAIRGACFVVTKSIPVDEIWAGNLAKFIKKKY